MSQCIDKIYFSVLGENESQLKYNTEKGWGFLQIPGRKHQGVLSTKTSRKGNSLFSSTFILYFKEGWRIFKYRNNFSASFREGNNISVPLRNRNKHKAQKSYQIICLSRKSTKMLAVRDPRKLPITTQFICRYMQVLKLKEIHLVAIFINSTMTNSGN